MREPKPKPLVTAGDKLRWIETVARDPSVSGFALKVAIAISSRLNGHTRQAIVSQAWLARAAGGSERGVRLAVYRLANSNRRYLNIDHHGSGPGNANIYSLVATETRNGDAAIDVETRYADSSISRETRNGDTALGEERRHGCVSKAAYPSTKGGMGMPPLPYSFHISSYPENYSNIRDRLIERLGIDVVSNWIDRLDFQGIDADTLALKGKTKFVSSYVRDHFHQALVDAWRSEFPELARIEIVGP